MFHKVFFCPSLTLSFFSPLFLLAAALGLRPLALLPRLCPLLGLGCAAGEMPSSSSGPTRHSPWGRSCSAGSTVTVFTSLRWLSMSPVIHRKGVDESACAIMTQRFVQLRIFWTGEHVAFTHAGLAAKTKSCWKIDAVKRKKKDYNHKLS